MACKGGCLGGGGEPKSMDPDVLQKRMQAIYALDKNAPRRRSHENQDVQKVYATELGYPNSPQAHQLLHTTHAPRHSKRLLLMQFLDCVDRRDAEGVARLFDSQALWSTASPLGEVQGIEQIKQLIASKLPPREYSAKFQRHRMASAANIKDLTVITPHGETCRFELETTQSISDSRPLIKKLVRVVLEN